MDKWQVNLWEGVLFVANVRIKCFLIIGIGYVIHKQYLFLDLVGEGKGPKLLVILRSDILNPFIINDKSKILKSIISTNCI